MKVSMKLLAVAVVSTAAAVMHVAQAESTYGYATDLSGTPTPQVSATAKAKVTVNIPKLVLLRVGTAGTTMSEVTLTGVPKNVADTGNSKDITWNDDGTPFQDSASQDLTAASWTNSPGGAKLTCAVTTAFSAGSNLLASDVKVSKSAGTLDHPGTTTECLSGSSSDITKNTLMIGTWSYSILGSALAKAPAGVYSEVITYTATTL